MPTKRIYMSIAVVAAGLLCSSSAALAVEAAAKSTVNVRTGPGTSYGIVGQLSPGEVVNVTECAPSNFCFVERSGPDGWVSANFLTAVEAASPEEDFDEGGGSNPDCSFGFSVGPGGPQLSVNCGDGPFSPPAPPPPPAPAPSDDPGACLYTGNNFSGAELCVGLGVRNALNPTFNNKISSVLLFEGARARLCDGPNMTGSCRNVNANTTPLTPDINNKTSSFTVFVGPAPFPIPPLPEPPAPPLVAVTHSTGPIELPQTFQANLDNGNVGGSGADIWYQAVTALEKYITPRNGAGIAVGDGSNRGFAGCSVASFSNASVPLASIPTGTYVCVKTNQGRISQFRVNGFVGTTMKLGYTTWKN